VNHTGGLGQVPNAGKPFQDATIPVQKYSVAAMRGVIEITFCGLVADCTFVAGQEAKMGSQFVHGERMRPKPHLSGLSPDGRGDLNPANLAWIW
jgi:hypothetical protein